MLPVGPIEHPAAPDVDDAIERCRGCGYAVLQFQPAQHIDLIAGDLLDAKLGGIFGVPIDQHDAMPGAAQNDRRRATR